MASEEQINNQKEFNDYIQESQEFLADTISKASQLADQIKFQIDQTKNKIGLDKQVLSLSQQSVNTLTKLKVDYQSISNIDKDRVAVLNQIQKNNNIITAQAKTLSQEELKAAQAYVLKTNSLKSQQDTLSDLISEQEQLEKAIQAAEASRADTTALYDQLTALDEQQEFYRQSIADLNNIITLEQQRLSPQAIAVGMLQDQNSLLEEGVKYLEEEADAVHTVAKAQSLWNASLGAVEGILKKAGAGGATIALGLERGKLEAEAMAEKLTNYGEDSGNFIQNIGREFKVLGAGIKGTFMGMADSLKAIGLGAILVKGLKGAFNLLGGKVVTGFLSDLKSKFMAGIDYIKNEFFSLDSYIADAKAGDQLLQQLSQHTADLATNLGVGTQEARELTRQAGKMSASMGMLPEELAAGIGELNKAFGTTQKFSDDTVKTFGQLTHLYGLTNQEASEFVKLSKLSGEDASDTALTYKTQIQALKERNNIAISEKEVMAEIAKSSASMQLTARGQGKSLAEAAFHAKKMGLSLKQTEGIGNSLLDFESSIANEMEAELLIGRDLNLERARSAALTGDLATVAKEVAGQIGSAAEFGKMNVIQQEALAKSVGVSRDELAEMLKTQELLAGTGFDDMNEAQKEYKKLLKETGSEEKALAKMKEMGASDALQDQMRQVSLQERRAQEERSIAAAQAQIAGAVNKVFSAFKKVEKIIKEVKVVIVEQMKPFFDSFGGMVGKGGDAFKEKVLPYAKALGKFMNDVGLRLVSIVNDNGPKIGDIFSGILEMFGAIYEVVGGVIKRLLGIQDAGSSAGGMFSGIKDTIDSIITKLKNVDISAITEKVKTFIEGIKNIFSFIMEKIGTVGSFLGKNKGLTKAMGAGALAMTIAPDATKSIVGASLKGLGGLIAPKLFGKRGQSKNAPMFVQDVGGGAGGGLMDMVGQMGGRQAGIGGGFKKGFKGLIDYTKMAFKGGRAGKVGRARLLRAGKGLLTGQGASFVGGTGKGSAKAAMKLAGAAGKLGKVAGSLGKLAAGGGIGAIAGLAVEATLGHFQGKAQKAADAIEDQITATTDEAKIKELSAQQQEQQNKADALAAAGTVGKYTAIGASIGSMIPVVGTAVGAIVGFTAGTIVAAKDFAKNEKWRNSEAYKLQKEYQRNQARIAKLSAQNEKRAQAELIKARMRGLEKEQALMAEYSEKLGTTITGAGDLQKANIDHTSDAFRQLALDALNAGTITEEEFAGALKGTIPAAQLLETAARNAGEKLVTMTSAVLDASKAIGKEEEERILKEKGVNVDLMNLQKEQLALAKEGRDLTVKQLESQFSDDLYAGYNTDASELLSGKDEDSQKALAAIRAQYETSGMDKKLIDQAIAHAQALFEKDDVEAAGNLGNIMETIDQFIEMGITADAKAAKAGGLEKQTDAATTAFEAGVPDLVAGLTKEQLEGNKDLQKGLTDLGIDITSALENGLTTEEYERITAQLSGDLTTASVKDKEKFDAVIGLLKANQKAELMKQADEARAAGNTTLADELTAQATTLDDFILRPGMSPLKFNEGDLLIGGTQLSSALGVENPIEKAMSAFGNITSSPSLSPIAEKVENLVDTLFKQEEKQEPETQNTEDLKVELQELKQIMSGFVEQMGQVVNRPITVELNGNKVGQALGQDSYRIQ